jgi:hypothetical protein
VINVQSSTGGGASRKAFLNIGGGNKGIAVPDYFAGWRHDLLDLDPQGKPDVAADARELETMNLPAYDAAYCAHNLEHYHRHEGIKVVRGVCRLLKPEGFFVVKVPDMQAVIQHVAEKKLDLDDNLYMSPRGPIQVRDVLYGYHVEVEDSGNDLYAHKTGFSPATLVRFVVGGGFAFHAVGSEHFELTGIFFKQAPTAEMKKVLGISGA